MRATANYIKRHSAICVLLVSLLVLQGCGTMMLLMMLGDNIRYSISGNVRDSSVSDAKCISGLKVSLGCPGVENAIFQNRKGTTDQSGYYKLSGYWELDGCEISFDHEGFMRKTIHIDQNHLIESEGLSRTYVVNAQLNPKTN
jgi:hypothetical protein